MTSLKVNAFSLFVLMILNQPLNSFADSSDCLQHNSPIFAFSDLVIKTRVYGAVDRRKELSAIAPELKLTKDEINLIRGAIGELFCEASGTFPKMSQTAFLIGNNREITTAGHGLVDSWGSTRDLSKCFFENFEIPPKREYLLAQNPRNILLAQPEDNENRNDRARLTLKAALTSARPLPPDFSGKKLAKGTPVFLLASHHNDFKASGADPIVSPCGVKEYYDPGDGLSRMKTDCDSGPGSSGGVVLFRDNDGKLYAKAVSVASTHNDYSVVPNKAPYNSETNATREIVIDQSFLQWYSK